MLFAALVTPLAPASAGDGNSRTSVPIRCDASRGILVPVAVNGGAARPFLLDTGASLTTIDGREADRLGLATAGSIPSGTGRVRLVHADLAIAGRAVVSAPVVAEDLKAFTAVVGSVGGILGSDTLRALGSLTIDYERCSLVVGGSEAIETWATSPVTLDWHEGRPVAPVAGGGRLLLDSGATTLTVFHRTRAAEALIWSSVPSAVVRIERADGVRVGHLGRVARVTIGSVELQNVPAVGVRSWYDPDEARVPDGLLPLSLFSRVRLDYRRGFAFLLPRSH
jgi:predicted aspartyl protease